MTKTQSLSPIQQRVDAVVRAKHEQRIGHKCEGYWTREDRPGMTTPLQFVTTCCDER